MLDHVRQANAGVTRALNAALEEASGVYIARMDADDLARPERFARQVEVLDAQPGVVALGTQFQLMDPQGRALYVLPVPCDHSSIDARLMQFQSLSILHPSVMIRAEAITKAGVYDSAYLYAEDIDMFLRLAEVGELRNLDEVLMDYRLHLMSIGNCNRSQQQLSAWKAGKAAAKRRGVPFLTPKPEHDHYVRRKSDTWPMCGWRALGAGNVATARYYAYRSLFHNPLSRHNWWLALIAARGY